MVYFYSCSIYRNGVEEYKRDGFAKSKVVLTDFKEILNFKNELEDALIREYMKSVNAQNMKEFELVFVALNPMF